MLRTKKKALTAALIGATMVAAVTMGAFSTANASVVRANATDAQLLTPKIHANGSDYYSQAQVPSVWAAVTGHFPKALPTGYRFPAATPPELKAQGDGPRAYQEGLPDVLAAQYWRCAWLDESLQPNLSKDAAATADRNLTMTTYLALPSVSANVSQSDLEAAVNSTAAQESVSAHQAEFNLMCSTLDIVKGN